jgi:uncharacterized protein YbjT (DUF2867 family)
MLAIIGASGNVGSSTLQALRRAAAPVRAVLRDPAKSAHFRGLGCEVAVADVQDAAALVEALTGADAVQVILPLRPQTRDPAADMRVSIGRIIEAVGRVKPKRVLLISDYGAHVDGDIGMPSVFHDFEGRLSALDVQLMVLRSAEHMHNWSRSFPAALDTGVLPSFEDPVDKVHPMIAARDLGRIAAELLSLDGSGKRLRIVHAEGPRRYSAADVANAMGVLSNREVQARALPRDQWNDALRQMPTSLADLLVKANDAKNRGGLVEVEANVGEVRYGTTELIDVMRPLMPLP